MKTEAMVDKCAPLQEDCLPGVVISVRAHVLMPGERRATAEFTCTFFPTFILHFLAVLCTTLL